MFGPALAGSYRYCSTLEDSGVPYRCQYSGAGLPGSEQHQEPMSDMRRREFITLFGGAAAAWPFATRAEQPTKPVIGLISAGTPESAGYGMTAFRQGLNEADYAEGRSVAIEYRWAEARYELMPELWLISFIAKWQSSLHQAARTRHSLQGLRRQQSRSSSPTK